MFSKREIIKSLNEFNYFIEDSVLNNFIKNWKIDPIYEDEDGVEFFDNMSLVKIKKGISLKAQGFDNDQIVYHINKILANNVEEVAAKPEPEMIPAVVPAAAQAVPVAAQSADMKNLTIDVTGQTLQMLAEAVASKITSEIKDQIQNSIISNNLFPDNSLKNDNEVLSKQVDELLDDNKKLAQRIEQLEQRQKPSLFESLRKFFA